MGIEFKNPIGLAAGADKNAEAIDGFGAMKLKSEFVKKI